MRVAYIGHAYHQKTGSTRFLIDLLERYATVDQWSGEPGGSGSWEWRTQFDENRYDIIVIFQMLEAFDLLSGRHPNVVFVPMYDAMFWAGNLYWKPSYNTAKIACFSWSLRQLVMRRGAVSAGFQYYPDPSKHALVDDFSTLRGLLWYRHREIPPELTFRLCGRSEFARFVVHDAPDPGHESNHAWSPPANIRQFHRTCWSDDGEAYAAALRNSNVYFAPRPTEGIGMSVLGAMASGHCVVAPDAATMNEYIANGNNGLLYVPSRIRPLDFAEARAIGARARESIERGHERWLTGIPTLLDFLATPTAKLRDGGKSIPVRNRFATEPIRTPADKPLVSVVTVCHNAGNVLEATMQSVLGQTGCNLEYLVLDRQSADHSVDIIRRYADRLAFWQSTRNDEPFAAMNLAPNLACGEWVLFLNAGDRFTSEDALRRMFARVPVDADLVYGHSLDRLEDGTDTLRHAAEFETTWSRLQGGDVWFDWLAGLPHQGATAVRRELLMRLQFDTRYRTVADHDLLFRARAQGAQFFNCDEVLAIRSAGTLSPPQSSLSRKEWLALAQTHANPVAADRLYALLEAGNAALGAPSQIKRVGRIALQLIEVLDRHSPAVARAVERIAMNPAARSVARRLLRRSARTTVAPTAEP